MGSEGSSDERISQLFVAHLEAFLQFQGASEGDFLEALQYVQARNWSWNGGFW